MKYSSNCSRLPVVSEMAIVDTFTKLIFGEELDYSSSELSIIHTLRTLDDQVGACSHQALGAYLRALGVSEMIELVADVHTRMISPTPPLPSATVAALTAAPG